MGVGPLANDLAGITDLLGVHLLVEDVLHVGVVEAGSTEDDIVDVVERDVVGECALDHPSHVLDRALTRLLLTILATQTRHLGPSSARQIDGVEPVATGVDTLDDAETVQGGVG